MAHPLKKGTILTEFALITPLVILFFLLVLQYALIVQCNWLVDFAAENACRAHIVKTAAHPDPEVAAQLTLIPVASTSFVRGTKSLNLDNQYLNWGARYLGSIAKTRLELEEFANGKYVNCTVRHAMELKIPVANHIIGSSTKLLDAAVNYAQQQLNDEEDFSLAEYWSAVSGRPHLLLEREVELRY